MKKPTKLGQNFLVDHVIIKKIIQESRINRDDVVYEVGSGKGILTTELCKISRFVHSFELDSILYSHCKRNLKHENLELLHLDGFNENLNIPFEVFFSSLPYYESRNAVTWLCQRNFRRGIILLQREFVEKLLSNPGEKNYRAISVLSQYRFSIKKLLDVPRTSFSPSPNVDSVLIELYPKTSPLTNKAIKDIQFLLSFRKKTTSFIVNYFKKNYTYDFDDFDHNGFGKNKLANLSPEDIVRFSTYLKNNTFNNKQIMTN
ncbi:16S rRNA (adenine(1518)-N(6)/adenine(1519)-N(6))-dimethyltransferaseRsmA [soil metagenome]